MTHDDSKLFLDSLRALQHTCRSMADQIGVILELAERPTGAKGRSSKCQHPPQCRVPNPAMGHSTRFFCNQCKQDVEG